MTIIWYMVPEIWSAPDRIFCHFGLFFALLQPEIWKLKKKLKKKHLEISFYTSVPGIMIIGYTVPEIWHVMDRIVIFYFGPVTAWKMKISKKWKKHLEVICTGVPKTMIICYTIPEIWHVADVIVIFPFGLFFALHPLTPQKMKGSKNEKKNWRYHHLTQVYQKSWSYALLSWDIWHIIDVIVIFYFGLFFALLPP